jgi:glycosyltransferase involved in cell wall biosynthesis
MRYPKISIVTPSFNHGKFIEYTVRSVVHQRYPALEYIVMDGGSTDETMSILDVYKAYFAHVTSERDEGQADAVARGFERSTGDIMAYLNSDDMLAPGTLEFVAHFFADHPNVDAIYSHRLAVDENNRVIWYWMLPKHNSYLMRRWDLIPQETCFWRRSLFERAGNVDKSFQFAMDYDLFVRYMAEGQFKRVNRFLAAFRQHSAAKTTQLMQTVGVAEVQRVWVKNGFKPRFFSPAISYRFWTGTTWRGAAFAEKQRVLPGNLPGIGYDFNRLWGGLLLRPLPAADSR